MGISFDEEETTMTTDKTTLTIWAQPRPLSRAPRGCVAREKVVQLFPRELIDLRYFNSDTSFEYLLSSCEDRFFAKDFSAVHGLKGRELYRTLNMLCKLSLIERDKTPSGAYMYSKIRSDKEKQ